MTRFLGCELDGEARTLSSHGRPVHLGPKALDLLLLLVAERPRAIRKAEILDRVWPDTFVTDASLARAVHEIREAVGDGATTVIRTIHGYGYAFSADAVDAAHPDGAAPPMARLAGWMVIDGQAIPVGPGELLIGRDPAVAIAMTSSQASWHHARLVVANGEVTLEDLGSKNGTEVNRRRLSTPTRLRDGDEIVIGAARFLFRTGERDRTETGKS